MKAGDIAIVLRPTLTRRWINAARGESATSHGPIIEPGDLLFVLDAETFVDWTLCYSHAARERLLVNSIDIRCAE